MLKIKGVYIDPKNVLSVQARSDWAVIVTPRTGKKITIKTSGPIEAGDIIKQIEQAMI